MKLLSSLIIPLILLLVGAVMMRRRGAYDSFLRGAKEGMRTSASLLPVMILLMTGLSMLTASGATELLSGAVSPVCERIGIPAEILPLVLTRPVSGSAASASFAELLEKYGADSFPGLAASVLMGSSDTMVYVITVYFGATRAKSTRHAFPVAAAVSILCLFLSAAMVRLFFGG